MYSRAFPVGNALFFFAGGVMSLFRLPRGKLHLAFLAVPAGKDGRVECPCQTVNDFIGIRGSVCGLFLFVQTHAPLIVWNNTLVDGHNRYEIVQEHPEISFSTMPLPFESREEVLAWICKNQLGRRNLTPEQKKFLIGKQYSVEPVSYTHLDVYKRQRLWSV